MLLHVFLLLLFAESTFCSLPVIHVIPHSHCDAGYRESFKQYYDGSVHKILDTMLEALNSNSSRKFVWEESSFLQYWWENDATSAQKTLMKQLVMDKRLEMIGGGWTMHDEAANNAATILSQMALGLKFLNESLNTRPKHEWHIDPFGHSIMMPELYKALKYDAIVINRIPDNIKQQMRKERRLEFFWDSNLSGASMFTHVLDMHYNTPSIRGSTTAERAASLAFTCNQRLKWYRTPNLLIPFGGDFNFVDANKQFPEMEELMDYINQRRDLFKISMQFSTLEDYFTAVMRDMPRDGFPEISDQDFFPYIACYPCYSDACGGYNGSYVPCGIQVPDGYWSGFYTSKPAQKLLAREQEASLAVLDRLSSFYPFLYKDMYNLEPFHMVQALLTHHDAITGTAFPPAYDDYNDKLISSLATQKLNTGFIKSHILCGPKQSADFFSNDTITDLNKLTGSEVAVMAVFNPLMESRSDYVRIQLPKEQCFNVSHSSNSTAEFQQVGSTLYVPMTVGPLEMQTLFVTKIKCPSYNTVSKDQIDAGSVSNGYIQLNFNDNNHISTLSDAETSETIGFLLEFTEMFEKKSSTNEKPDSVCDGSNVYTYVPDEGSQSLSPKAKNLDTVTTASGPLVWEVQQKISTQEDSACPVLMTIRLFKPINEERGFFKRFMEVQNTVGPLEEKYANSIRFSVTTSLNTKDNFTTYTSGLYPMMRKYNYSKAPQGNYYPLVGRVSMQDHDRDIAVIVSTQRPMAVTSRKGTLDLLVHRRIALSTDPRGNDTSIMADPVYVGLSGIDDVNEVSYNAMSLSQSPFTVYSTISPSLSDWYKQCNSTYAPINNPLPKGVKLLGLEVLEAPVKGSSQYKVGVRVVNIGTETVKVDLSHMFAPNQLHSVVESTPDYLVQLRSLTDDGQSSVWTLNPYKLASAILTLDTI